MSAPDGCISFRARGSRRTPSWPRPACPPCFARFPLFPNDLPRDIVIVTINPQEREGVPSTPTQIQDRINEISFNSSLLRELRAIAFVKRLADEGRLQDRGMKIPLIHMVSDEALMTSLRDRVLEMVRA